MEILGPMTDENTLTHISLFSTYVPLGQQLL